MSTIFSQPAKEDVKVHLKDEYYHTARNEYIDILKFIGAKGIPLSEEAVEALKMSIKTHYSNIQGF